MMLRERSDGPKALTTTQLFHCGRSDRRSGATGFRLQRCSLSPAPTLDKDLTDCAPKGPSTGGDDPTIPAFVLTKTPQPQITDATWGRVEAGALVRSRHLASQ